MKRSKKEIELRKMVRRAIAIEMHLQDIKELYRERDDLIEFLLESGSTSFKDDGVVLTLIDTFADKNKAWKSTPFSRFTLQITG
jgi:hypothetical protein